MAVPDPDIFPEPLFIDVDGIRTRYYDEGTGSPILMIQGGDFRSYATADDWSRNIGPLSSSNRVLAIDKLGKGHTDNPRSDADYTLTASAAHILPHRGRC